MFKKLAPMGQIEFIVLMAFLMALNALATDMILPAFQDLRIFFNLSKDDNSLPQIVFFYFIGMSIGQLLYGPLADAIGRKKTIYIGMSIYIFGALGIIFSGLLSMMFFFRFIQGFGAAAMRVLAVTIVRDQYKGRMMAEIMSLVMIVFMAVPVLAPTFGQMVILIFPWEAMFVILILAAIWACLWVHFRLPESLKAEDIRPFTVHNTIQGLVQTLRDRSALCYTFVAAFIFGTFTFFLGSAEDIYGEIFHIRGFQFTLSFAGAAIFMAVGNLLNSRLVKRFGMRKISQVGMLAFLTVSLVMVVVAQIFGGFPPFALFLCLFATLLFFNALIFANTNTMAMENMGHLAGSAASVIGFLSTMTAVVVGNIISLYYAGHKDITTLAFAYLICGSIAFIFMLFAEKFKLFQAHETNPH